jgi:toxin secretion/phage lysis holin|uniref:Holin n=2 Tax=root TaxID=1 RepID=A0A8S5NEK4_9CAUD|nr:MAG TPA: holin [Siphoviridae sp. ctNyC15]
MQKSRCTYGNQSKTVAGLIFILKYNKKEVRYMKMEQANYIKAIFTAVFAFISALLGVLAVPVILLVTCNLIDYATGLMASKYRSQDINSYKSIRGIFKKVSMWLLVVVGAIIDELLLYAATTIGKPVPVTFLIACIVAMWLICNEIISILENIQDMGVNIPAFLQPLVKHIRSQVEERINIDEKDEKDSEDE